MADPAIKQQETLDQILKTLKSMAPPNPAEEKKQQELEAKAAKDLADAAAAQKKLAEAEAKKAAERKALEEKRRGSLSLMGDLFKGLKDSSMSYFEKTKENQITWGGLGQAMKTSVKNWFDKAKKSDSMLGKTLRVFSTAAFAWKSAVQQFQKVFASVVGHVREVLGPVAAAFDVAKEAIMGTFAFFKGIIGHFFQQMPPGDRKRNKFLQKIVKELVKSRKKSAREGGGEEPAFLKKMKGIAAGFKILGHLMLAFIGIAVLIYGAWQFFKGFSETEGSFWDKMKGGYSRAIKKLLYWPLKLFEKLLIMMGIDAQGMTDAVMGWIDPFVDFLVEFNPARPFIEFLKGFTNTDGTFWEKLKMGFAHALNHVLKLMIKWGPILSEAISPIIDGIVGFFAGFWNSAVDWMVSQLPDWGFLDDTREWISGMKLDSGGTSESGGGSSLADEVERQRKAELEAAKIKAQKEKEMEEERKRLAQAQLDAQNATADSTVAIANANAAGGGGGGAEQPIPDEIDNMGATSKNYDMEMFGGV